MSGDFFDSTEGYNGFFAAPGYDLVTGLGSPYAPWVVSDLAVAGFGTNAPNATAPMSSLPTFLGGSHGSDWATFLAVPTGHGGEVNHITAPMSSLPTSFGSPHGSDSATSLAVAPGHGGEVSHVTAPTPSPARGTKNAVDAVFAEPSFAGSTAVSQGLDLSDLDINTLRSNLNL